LTYIYQDKAEKKICVFPIDRPTLKFYRRPQRSLWAAPLRHSRIKNGNGACKFSFSSEMVQKVNLRPMEFAYRVPMVGIADANLAILSSDLHSGDK
jgi:hypothetical protein